jgi:hypothetical protein
MPTTTTSTNGKTHDPVSEAPPISEAPPASEAPIGQRDDGTEARLTAIESELRDQGRTVRMAQRSWGIFAFFALVIAAANLIAVATKLDGKSSSAAAPAAAAATAAQPTAPATPGKVGVSLKEFTINPTATQAPAGRVTFNVRNNGAVTH